MCMLGEQWRVDRDFGGQLPPIALKWWVLEVQSHDV